ncbi:hypothetical protein [Actinoplanes sp. NPDC051494]|uniref:hypothetical protein n=1 Tax=Actinoplanes sp. NPDC051494 TaxID=3363907 RepID=UPI0037B2280D
MRFGIYLGGRVGALCSRPDDPGAVALLIDDLADGRPFVVREYLHFTGGTGPGPLTMPDDWYLQNGRELDLVLSYIPAHEDIPGWLAFIDAVLDRYGHLIRYLQVTLEPNFPLPGIDGSSPGVLAALTRGLPHARAAADPRIRVGFSVAEPAGWLGGDDAFWQHLAAAPGFAAAVDYVGLAVYPDAFSPVPPGAVGPLTAHALRHLRTTSLPIAHITPTTPIHIVENGSPGTGEAPCVSLTTMITTILDHAAELNITHYELFALRDADSASPEPTGTFGLVTDTYTAKPALAAYRDAIRRASAPNGHPAAS